MALIDLIVNLNITATSATPSLPGTDIPAIIGYHTHYTDKIRTYFDPAGMLTDGFSSTEALYQMALAIAQQSPRPAIFKVIRGTTAVAQVIQFTVTDTQTGDSVGFNLIDNAGVVHPVFHTVTVGQTAAQIATALAATVVAGATLGSAGPVVTVTINTAGDVWGWSAAFGGTIADTTPTTSPQNDLAAAALVDPNFYGVAGEWFDTNNIQAIAAWTEANTRLHAYTTGDSNNLVSGQGVFSTLKAAAYNRSYGQFSGTPRQYGALALMAQRLTADAGSDTWAFKTLNGVTVDILTASQITAATSLEGLPSNNGNVYVPVANVNTTLNGLSASGLFTDIQRGIDGLSRDMQLRIFTLLKTSPKVPFTRKGISAIGGEMAASLQAFVTDGFLSNDVGFAPVVTMPDVSTVAPTDKSNRILRNAKFTAVAQGAIQTVLIQGSVNF